MPPSRCSVSTRSCERPRSCHDAVVTLVAVVLIGVVILVAVALGLAYNDDGLREEAVDHADLGLPDRPLTADDVSGLRFRVGFRGYRMEDVDAALDRIEAAMRGEPGR
jgi:DivIVA domain-containing protein